MIDVEITIPCPSCGKPTLERFYCGGRKPDEWAKKYGFVKDGLYRHDFSFLACECGFVITSADSDYPLTHPDSKLRYQQ